MQPHDPGFEILALQQRLNTISAEFDAAAKKDMPLGDLKKIFHEMKILKDQLNALTENQKQENKHV